jgi:hypothetical protein
VSEIAQLIGRLVADVMDEIEGDPGEGAIDLVISYKVAPRTPWDAVERSHRVTVRWDANGCRRTGSSTTERRDALA